MIFTYKVTQQVHYIGDDRIIFYGIAVYDKTDSLTLIKDFNDISTDQAAIENLVKRCNHGKLSVIHIDEVIEDFLAN